MLRRWGSITRLFAFINWVDNLNWRPQSFKFGVLSVSLKLERRLWKVDAVFITQHKPPCFFSLLRYRVVYHRASFCWLKLTKWLEGIFIRPSVTKLHGQCKLSSGKTTESEVTFERSGFAEVVNRTLSTVLSKNFELLKHRFTPATNHNFSHVFEHSLNRQLCLYLILLPNG